MKLKRLMASTLVLALSLSLAACGNSNKATGNTTSKGSTDKKTAETMDLDVAIFEGGYGSEYWKEVAKEFEAENKGVTVKITANPKIGDIIRPNIVAGNPPDFIYLASSQKDGIAQALIKDKGLADLSDVFTDELKAKMLPGFIDSSLMQPYGDGKTFLAPLYYSPLGWWYNKNYFEKNNLKAPETWDDFFALKGKIKDRSLFAYQGSHPGYLEGTIMPALASELGINGLTDCLSYKDGSWNKDGVVKSFNIFEKMGKEGTLMKGTTSMQFSEAQLEFMMGKAAFIPNGTWFEGEMKDAPREDGFKWGFCAPPVFSKDSEKFLKTTCEEMYVPAAAKHVDMAKKFLAFQYTNKAIALNAKYAKGIPPVVGAADVLKEYVSDATYQAQAIFEKGYKPFVGGWAAVKDTEIMPKTAFYDKVSKVFGGEMTGKQWSEEISKMSKELSNKVVK